MRIHSCLLLRAVAVAWMLTAIGAVAREPANLDPLKAEIRTYVESGEYEREIAAVAAQAEKWIGERAAKRAAGERLAVVFDLDETLLSNWPLYRTLDFGYQPAAWTAWVDEGRAPAIEPVRAVYRTVRKLGVDVVFITGRRERDRAGTEKNLRAIECADFVMLLCTPDADKGTSAAFKTAARQKLTAEGRVIIANLGDQQSDLAGGYAERTFKLPNPFYLSE